MCYQREYLTEWSLREADQLQTSRNDTNLQRCVCVSQTWKSAVRSMILKEFFDTILEEFWRVGNSILDCFWHRFWNITFRRPKKKKSHFSRGFWHDFGRDWESWEIILEKIEKRSGHKSLFGDFWHDFERVFWHDFGRVWESWEFWIAFDTDSEMSVFGRVRPNKRKRLEEFSSKRKRLEEFSSNFPAVIFTESLREPFGNLSVNFPAVIFTESLREPFGNLSVNFPAAIFTESLREPFGNLSVNFPAVIFTESLREPFGNLSVNFPAVIFTESLREPFGNLSVNFPAVIFTEERFLTWFWKRLGELGNYFGKDWEEIWPQITIRRLLAWFWKSFLTRFWKSLGELGILDCFWHRFWNVSFWKSSAK